MRDHSARPDPNWDGDLYRLYHKRLGDYSWQDDFLDDTPDHTGDTWPAVDDAAAQYGRALFGGPGADLLGSAYSAADQTEHTRPPRRDSGPYTGSMPSISQPLSSVSQSMPSVPESIPAIPRAGRKPERDEFNDTGTMVRPYARTRGRTRTDYDLAIETLVSTTERGRQQSAATPEHRSICGLCQEARSVAEISAHLRLPLGVVRVLIGDMAHLGLLLIHDSGMVVGDQPSMEFLERVLSGLRRL